MTATATELGYSDEYDIPAHVTLSAEVGVGYIYLTDHKVLRKVSKTVVVGASRKLRNSINLDFDGEGRLIGIELMDHKMAPPQKTCDCRDLLTPYCCTLSATDPHKGCPQETIVWCDEHNCLIGCSCRCHQRPEDGHPQR
jgi:uncharacterized protein YuzE